MQKTEDNFKAIKCIKCHKRILDAGANVNINIAYFIPANRKEKSIIMKCPHCKERLQIDIKN